MSAYAMPVHAMGLRRGTLLRTRRAGGEQVQEVQHDPAPAPPAVPAPAVPSAPPVPPAAPSSEAAVYAVDADGIREVGLEWTPPSWDQVVREHSARVYRLAYRLTGNRHDAEDLTQEVFVRVFRSLSSYTPGTFEGWLHRITTNLFLDQVRRKQRIRFDALPEDAGDRLAGSDPGPERAWEHNNLDHDIQAALDTLPPEFRAAVVLCDIEGLSYEEIAATLDVKLGTVRSRIHRGRAQLRQALAHRRPQAGEREVTAARAGGETGR